MDLIVLGASEVVTCRGPAPRVGKDLADAGIIKGGAVAVKDGIIQAVGPQEEIEPLAIDSTVMVDAHGGTVIPGFIDTHTHPIFAGGRADELDLKLQGLSYLEILKQGGGIMRTVRASREAPAETITHQTRGRFDRMLALGTTTIEAKSGYGLSSQEEIRHLRILKALAEDHPLEVHRTFMGAHARSPEYPDDPSGFIEDLIANALPTIVREDLASAIDVFCEKGVFELEDSRRICQAGKDVGLAVRIHADEIHPLGGTGLAAELGALSADHLLKASEADLLALKAAGSVATFLPGTLLSLRTKDDPPVRFAIDNGVPVALATDLNPNCWTESMSLVISLACYRLGMRAGEALQAATINAAYSLRQHERIGSIEVGKQADLAVLDLPSHLWLPYRFGHDDVRYVIKEGELVVEKHLIGAGAYPVE